MGGGGSNLSVGLTLSVLISNFDSPLNDIFFFLEKTEIANFADDNTPYCVEDDIMTLLKSLESDTYTVLNWFRFNEMKPNQGKCHLLVAEIDHKLYDGSSFILLEDAFLENEESARLLGVHVDTRERGNGDFVIPRVRTVNRGEETVRYRGPVTWEMVLEDIKASKSLAIFKNKIKKWRPSGCTCRLCKKYVQGLGFGFFRGDIFIPK